MARVMSPRCTAALLVAAFVLPGLAAADPADDALKRSNHFKSIAVQRLSDLQGQVLRERFPPDQRVRVFLDVHMADFLLEHAEVRLNGNRIAEHDYSDAEARALRDQPETTHAIARDTAAPGVNTLEVRYRGRTGADGDPVSGSYRLNFDKTDRGKLLTVPVLPGHTVRDARNPTAGGVAWQSDPDDARLGMVRLLQATDRPLAALLFLLEISASVTTAESLPAGFHTLLASGYIDLGMRDQAYRALADAAEAEEPTVAVTGAAIDLAALEYRHRHVEAALAILENHRDRLTPVHRNDWEELRGRCLLALGHNDRAVGALQAVDWSLDEAPHVHFNLAVALIRRGDDEAGRKLLDRLGRADDGKLRDKANLALGYEYLRAGDGERARRTFARLPWRGPHTSRALAGFGWSELAPLAGDGEPPRETGGIRFGPFVFGASEVKPEEAAARAMSAWNALLERHPLEPAVQEARVARAYTLARTGDHQGAVADYEAAVDWLTDQRRRLDRLVQDLQRGEYAAALARDEYGELPQTAWLRHTVAESRFRQLQRNYQELRFLQGALAQADPYGTRVMQQALSQIADRNLRAAQMLIVERAERQDQVIDNYILAAHRGRVRLLEEAREARARPGVNTP